MEVVITKLEKSDSPVSFEKLKNETGYLEEELSDIINELRNMGIVYKTNSGQYMLYQKTDYIVGTVYKTPSNRYFLKTRSDEKIDVDIKKGDILSGDLIAYDPTSKKNPLQLIKRSVNSAVGKYLGNDIVQIVSSKYSNIVIKLTNTPNDIMPDEYINVNIGNYISDNCYEGTIASVICSSKDPDANTKILIASEGIPTMFSEKALEEANNIPLKLEENDKNGRKDLTHIPFITIDSKTTMDIDDAVYAEKFYDSKGRERYRLFVSIADVSYYVKEGSAIDDDARLRTTSVYPPNHTVNPMLPKSLSDGICSLNEGAERATLTCEMIIDNDGNIWDYDVYPSYICSRKKATYEECNKILMENIIPEGYESISDNIKLMNELSKSLIKNREHRGAQSFILPKIKCVFDRLKRCVGIKPELRFDAEKLIESLMIAANESVAKYLKNMGIIAPFRDHESPNPEKINTFLEFISDFYGITIIKRSSYANPKDLQKIDYELRKYEDLYPILSPLLLRCTQKAIYSTRGIGHYALALMNYLHFTSPIRRYADLTVHRILKKIWAGKYNEVNNDITKLIEICNACSEKERASERIERILESQHVADYMSKYEGKTFSGTVSKVNEYGYYVILSNGVEGYVPANLNKYKCYQYNNSLMCLYNETGNVICPGRHIECTLDKTDSKNGSIRLLPLTIEYAEIDIYNIMSRRNNAQNGRAKKKLKK